jgi:tetratricopeptide (TPR) repeat protein
VRLFRLVCLAVDYAHRQSVVHRDLKPDNVLVTPDGTPKVTDFGLAKSTDRRTGRDQSLTETGGVLGSPSYMAPEQAGGSGEVGPAADVYALGAILYELLTGRPPFRAETPVQTVFQVLHEDPPPPRRLDPRVPRDLETICLTCLAKEPARRYASAAALADDVGRFLAGEPILARPVSRAERLWRQCRRRPLVAGLLAALALALTGGFVAALTLWVEAERRGVALRKEKEAADRQRDQARRAVDDMYTQVAERWLAAEPHMQEMQREFLQKALDYYQELARESGDDPEVRHRTAQAYYRIGNLYAKLGDGPRAEESQRRAIALWRPLAREHPDDPRFPLALFHTHLSLTHVLAMVGRRDEIPAAERQALTHAEDLVRRFPDDPLHHDLLAYHYKTLSMRELSGERYREAEELCRRGLAVAEGLTRQYPQRSMFGRNVARNLHVLAGVYQSTGRPAEALDALRAALRAASAVDAANDPTVLPFDRAMFRLELALYHYYLGDGLMTDGRPDEAEPHLAQSVAISEKMAGDYPALCSCRLQFATVLAGLGQCHHLAGRAGPAEEAYARHLRLLEQLVADFPGLAADIKWRLAWALCTCPVERFRDGARAIALIVELYGPSPARREHRFALGLARYRAGDWRGCVPDLEKGLTGDPVERTTSAFYLAMAHRQLGDAERARDYYRRAVDGLSALVTPDLLALRGEAERVLGVEITSPR